MSKQNHRGEYPPDWNVIAATVKAEAGNRCVRCGHPNGDRSVRCPVPEGGPGPTWNPVNYYFMDCTEHCTHPMDYKPRVLTVHHLDCDKSNVAWWNLAALCQVCHLHIQSKVVMAQMWALEHTPWFQPYAAGYYAHRAGLPHDRQYVMDHLAELLALGQPVMP